MKRCAVSFSVARCAVLIAKSCFNKIVKREPESSTFYSSTYLYFWCGCLPSNKMISVVFFLFVKFIAVSAIAVQHATLRDNTKILPPHNSQAANSIKCKPVYETTRFMWDPATLGNYSNWFQIKNVEIGNSNLHKKRVNKHHLFNISEDFGVLIDRQYTDLGLKSGKDLLQNNNFTSPNFPLTFYDTYFDIHTKLGTRLATFHNVLTNNYGIIVDPNDCSKQIMNGGCITGHGKVFKFESSPVQYDLVISLTNGASGTWHFPMELMISLRNIEPSVLRKAKIHVPIKSGYIVEWLSLIRHVDPRNIVSDAVIRANTLLVPEMSRCSFPYPVQLEWLAYDGLTFDPVNMTSFDHAETAPTTTTTEEIAAQVTQAIEKAHTAVKNTAHTIHQTTSDMLVPTAVTKPVASKPIVGTFAAHPVSTLSVDAGETFEKLTQPSVVSNNVVRDITNVHKPTSTNKHNQKAPRQPPSAISNIASVVNSAMNLLSVNTQTTVDIPATGVVTDSNSNSISNSNNIPTIEKHYTPHTTVRGTTHKHVHTNPATTATTTTTATHSTNLRRSLTVTERISSEPSVDSSVKTDTALRGSSGSSGSSNHVSTYHMGTVSALNLLTQATTTDTSTPNNNNNATAATDTAVAVVSSTDTPPNNTPNNKPVRNMILVERSKTRKVGNANEVRTIVEQFAAKHHYNLILQDEKHLPPLKEQIHRFAISDIVVLPHGAGGIFINFSPENACIIEFLPDNNWNVCYARVAYIRQLNYISYMQGTNYHIDAGQLGRSLNTCYDVVNRPADV